MTKLELIEELAKRCELSKKKAGEVLNAFCEIVKEKVSSEEEVRIPGFGVWKVVERKARTGINPKTKKKMKIPKKKVVKFVRGKALSLA